MVLIGEEIAQGSASSPANAYSATAVFPADVCAATNTLSPRSRRYTASFWNTSRGNGKRCARTGASRRSEASTSRRRSSTAQESELFFESERRDALFVASRAFAIAESADRSTADNERDADPDASAPASSSSALASSSSASSSSSSSSSSLVLLLLSGALRLLSASRRASSSFRLDPAPRPSRRYPPTPRRARGRVRVVLRGGPGRPREPVRGARVPPGLVPESTTPTPPAATARASAAAAAAAAHPAPPANGSARATRGRKNTPRRPGRRRRGGFGRRRRRGRPPDVRLRHPASSTKRAEGLFERSSSSARRDPKSSPGSRPRPSPLRRRRGLERPERVVHEARIERREGRHDDGPAGASALSNEAEAFVPSGPRR